MNHEQTEKRTGNPTLKNIQTTHHTHSPLLTHHLHAFWIPVSPSSLRYSDCAVFFQSSLSQTYLQHSSPTPPYAPSFPSSHTKYHKCCFHSDPDSHQSCSATHSTICPQGSNRSDEHQNATHHSNTHPYPSFHRSHCSHLPTTALFLSTLKTTTPHSPWNSDSYSLPPTHAQGEYCCIHAKSPRQSRTRPLPSAGCSIPRPLYFLIPYPSFHTQLLQDDTHTTESNRYSADSIPSSLWDHKNRFGRHRWTKLDRVLSIPLIHNL